MMKRMLLSGATLISLLFYTGVAATAAETYDSVETKTTNISKAATFKLWFKGIPPEKYNGKLRIDYYKTQGGYIGVYLNTR